MIEAASFALPWSIVIRRSEGVPEHGPQGAAVGGDIVRLEKQTHALQQKLGRLDRGKSAMRHNAGG